MSWKFLYLPDLIIAPIFVYILIALNRSKNAIHHTPFYSFFISTGICGIATVITHFTVNQIAYSPEQYWIFQAGLMINENGTLGATIGKFYIALHRYCVMREFHVRETIWSKRLVRLLILIQFILPTAFSIFFVLPAYSSMDLEDGRVVLSVKNRALIMQKYVNTSVFSVYCVACLLLTYLSSRKLSSLGRNLEGNSRRTVLKQQYNLFLIVAVCCISHVLKAIQQFSVFIISSYHLDRATTQAIIYPTYVLTNSLATYSPAFILVLRSSKVRALLLWWIRPLQLNLSSTPSPNALQGEASP